MRENHIDPSHALIVHTDVYNNLQGHYDFILANPPYLSRARLARIEPSVLEHEPMGALFAEDDGFALIDATLSGLSSHLASSGQCWIEHEPEHAPRILKSASRLGYTATTYRDQYGIERYSVILKP